MVQTNNRFFDEIGRLMNSAAGMTQGLRREIETMMRAQAERMLREFDVVKRDEFEAVKDMARLAREENESLRARIAALEGGRPGLSGSERSSAPFGSGSATSPASAGSPVGMEGGGLAGSGTGVGSGSSSGSAGASRGATERGPSSAGAPSAATAPHLPSEGVEAAGPPKTGAQTPSKPTSAAGDPSI